MIPSDDLEQTRTSGCTVARSPVVWESRDQRQRSIIVSWASELWGIHVGLAFVGSQNVLKSPKCILCMYLFKIKSLEDVHFTSDLMSESQFI